MWRWQHEKADSDSAHTDGHLCGGKIIMNNNLNPITRKEMFLAKAAGQEVPTPTPITKIEKFLQNLIDHISAIGGGSSGTGAQPNLSQNNPEAADYVKGRTHWKEEITVHEPLNITWDGNVEGLLSISGIFYKVSDLVLTDEQIMSATVRFSNGSTLNGQEHYQKESEDITAIADDAGVIFANKDNVEINGLVVPEAGIYFFMSDGLYAESLVTSEPVEHLKSVYNPMDDDFIPSTVPRVPTASIGQTIVVKAVDDSGKPTEWEAVDMPSKVTLYVQSAQQGSGDSYLYHTADAAKNGDESLRVTKEQFQNIIETSVLVITDTEIEFFWTPNYTDINDIYGRASINAGKVVYTSEYGSGPM